MAASSSRTYPTRLPTKHSGFGGFPMPHEIAHSVFSRLFPKLKRKLTRTVTIPATTTIASHRGDTIPPGVRTVPYISFEAVVRRNSNFPLLSTEQLEEIGGVEYRALNALQWIVACVRSIITFFPIHSPILNPVPLRCADLRVCNCHPIHVPGQMEAGLESPGSAQIRPCSMVCLSSASDIN